MGSRSPRTPRERRARQIPTGRGQGAGASCRAARGEPRRESRMYALRARARRRRRGREFPLRDVRDRRALDEEVVRRASGYAVFPAFLAAGIAATWLAIRAGVPIPLVSALAATPFAIAA